MNTQVIVTEVLVPELVIETVTDTEYVSGVERVEVIEIAQQGVPGAKGDKGDKGDTGDTGAKGDTGDTGLKGDKGDKGDTGDTGAQGAPGSLDGFPLNVANIQDGDILTFSATTSAWTNRPRTEITDGGNF